MDNGRDVFVLSGTRTAIGKFGSLDGFVKATMVRSHVARRRLSVVTITPRRCAILSARPRAYVCILCG